MKELFWISRFFFNCHNRHLTMFARLYIFIPKRQFWKHWISRFFFNCHNRHLTMFARLYIFIPKRQFWKHWIFLDWYISGSYVFYCLFGIYWYCYFCGNIGLFFQYWFVGPRKIGYLPTGPFNKQKITLLRAHPKRPWALSIKQACPKSRYDYIL
jgi:hypothetical protein